MNWWTKAKTFYSETKAEMKKVTFPTRDEVIQTTIVVLLASLVFAVFLWLSDIVILWLYQGILGFFSS